MALVSIYTFRTFNSRVWRQGRYRKLLFVGNHMEFLPYEDGSGYEARFTSCGICTLMKKLRLYEYVPAMCRLDYAMSEAGGASDFVREYTLSSGGPYCDCGYKKKV